MSDRGFIEDYLAQSEAAVAAFRRDAAQVALLEAMSAALVACLQGGGRVLLFGNGGSAGDAQHLAGEFTGRMLYDRAPLAAVALHCDTSALTAIGNDYGFEHIYERQVIALGRPGDVVWGLSTSGNSANVLRALDAGVARGMVAMGFAGLSGGAMASRCKLLLRAPSHFTPVVQQVHMVAGHILCGLVERAMFPPA